VQEGKSVVASVLPILGKPATATKPADGRFDNPAHGFDHESLGMVGPCDDFDRQVWHCIGGAVPDDRPGIGFVCEQLLKERDLSEQAGQQQDAAVAILNVGGCHQRVQHQAQCINQDMALLALDQFAGIEPMWIDARPPLSALFTLWLSTMQAVGLASRSACSRT